MPKSPTVLLLLLSYFASTAGSAITWTGLPLYLVKVSGDFSRMTDFFLMSTIANLLFILIGGWFADRFSRKGFAIALNLASALTMGGVYFSVSRQQLSLMSVLIFCVFLLNALLEVILSCWYLGQGASKQTESLNAIRFSWIAGAKILGMSMGPMLFRAFGAHALWIDAMSFIIAAGLQSCACDERRNQAEAVSRDLLSGSKTILGAPAGLEIILAAIASGLLAFPLINLFVTGFFYGNARASGQLSVFWLLGGVGFVLSGALFRRLRVKSSPKSLSWALTGGVMIACLGSAAFHGSVVVMLFFCVYTLLNPGMNVLLGSLAYQLATKQEQGRVVAFYGLLVEAGSLLGLLLIKFSLISIGLSVLLLGASAVIAIRGLLYDRVFGVQCA